MLCVCMSAELLTECDDRVDHAVCALYVVGEEVKQRCGGLITRERDAGYERAVSQRKSVRRTERCTGRTGERRVVV